MNILIKGLKQKLLINEKKMNINYEIELISAIYSIKYLFLLIRKEMV